MQILATVTAPLGMANWTLAEDTQNGDNEAPKTNKIASFLMNVSFGWRY